MSHRCLLSQMLVAVISMHMSANQVENFYTTTSLSWKPDGSRLAVGSLTGCVDLYDACIKKYKYVEHACSDS